MTRQATRLALEMVALVFMLAIFIAGFAIWRLSGGPVDLDVLRPNAEAIFADAFQGETVELGDIQSEWRPEARAIVVTASNVTIRSEDGEIVSVASRIAAALPATSLAQGEFAPLWVEAEGGAFSIIRRRDGEFAFGLGTPRRALDREEDKDPAESPSLDWREFELPAEAVNLRRLHLSHVVLFVQFRDIGLNWRIRNASLDANVSRDTVTTKIAGDLVQGQGSADLNALISADLGVKRIAAEGRIGGINPSVSAPRRLSPAWRAIDAPTDIEWRVATGRNGRLSGGRLAVSVGEGAINLGGSTRPVEHAELRARYETGRQTLVLENLDLQSQALRFQGAGVLSDLFSGDAINPSVDLTLSDLELDMPGILEAPLAIGNAGLKGEVDFQETALDLESLSVGIEGLSVDLGGRVALTRDSGQWGLSALQLSGGASGETTPAVLMRVWPMGFATGGRVWIAEHVDAGRISGIKLDLDLNAGDVARGRLNDDDLKLAFAMDQGAVRYVSTMTPVTEASGSAVLRGNSFTLMLDHGRIGEMELTEGGFDIPRLKPKGAPAVISGVAHATAPQILALLDQEPLGFPSKFGIGPDAVQGEGTLRFEITRPMRSNIPAERIGFDVVADFDNLSAPTGFGGLRLTDGKVHMEATPSGLTARGPARIGALEAVIAWQEKFGVPEGEDSTTYRLEAVLDQADFDALGVPLRQYLDGPVLLSAQTSGDGLSIRQGQAAVDLSTAAIGSPGDVWSKARGAPAQADFTFSRNGQSFRIGSAKITSAGLDIQGAADFSNTGQLNEVSLDTVKIADFADLTFRLYRKEAAFDLSVTGDYLDVRWLMDRALSSGGGNGSGIPVTAEITLDRALISDTLTAEQLKATIDHSSGRVEAASIHAQAAGEPVSLTLAPGEGAARSLTASAEDAGLLFGALFGIDQVKGGRFTLNGQSASADAPWMIQTRVEDFDLVRAPILARLFSLASLQGLVDVLGGTGLSFDEMQAEASFDQGRIRIEKARASGQALGITTSGEIDLPRSELALNGVLVPSYGVNASVGALPVIGELLTSREGEGLFALTYSISGPFDETQVVVNPLSALAPGIFRRIFEGGVTLEEAQTEAETQSPEIENDAESGAESTKTAPESTQNTPENEPENGPG